MFIPESNLRGALIQPPYLLRPKIGWMVCLNSEVVPTGTRCEQQLVQGSLILSPVHLSVKYSKHLGVFLFCFLSINLVMS